MTRRDAESAPAQTGEARPAPGRGARFSGALDPHAAALNASVAFDHRLAEADVAGSKAHVRMLARVGLVTAEEADAVARALDQALAELRAGTLRLDPALEDIHMNLERRVSELTPAGARLHTGRSRNDQVATDLRLYARTEVAARRAEIAALSAVLVARAREHVDTLVPGLTHLQRAQPVRLAHHLLAYVEMLARDDGRLRDAAARADESPLGAGALAGTSLPIDRDATREALGFSRITRNSLDAVSDRDFAVEIAAACALTGAHLSRLAEELVLWSTPEVGFVRLPETHCSGSSLMPQKRNPDVAELVRAKAARGVGAVVTLLGVLKGLPLSYNKDLQETQEPLYDALETLGLSLRALRGGVAGAEIDARRMREAVEASAGDLCATDLAEALVRSGLPFRRAHELVGAAVREAEIRGVALGRLDRTVLAAALENRLDDADLAAALDPVAAIERRALPGGPARARVLEEIHRWERALS